MTNAVIAPIAGDGTHLGLNSAGPLDGSEIVCLTQHGQKVWIAARELGGGLDPKITFTGGPPKLNFSFTTHSVGSWFGGAFHGRLLGATYDGSTSETITGLDLGNIQLLLNTFSPSFASALVFKALNLVAVSGAFNFVPTLAAALEVDLPKLAYVGGNFAPSSMAQLDALDLPALAIVGNTLTINGAVRLTRLTLPVLALVGVMTISSNSVLPALDLPALNTCNGVFTVTTMAALTRLTAPALVTVAGNFVSSGLSALATLDLSALATVGGNFLPTGWSVLPALNLPQLNTVTGDFSPNTMAALTTLNAPLLASVGGSFKPSAMAALTTLSVPALASAAASAGATFTPNTMASLTTLNFPALAAIGGGSNRCDFNPSAMAALTTISLPALATMIGDVIVTTGLGNLTSFSFGAGLLTCGSVTITGQKLTQAAVDGILVSLSKLDGTLGTTPFGSRTVDLSGGTSAAPSATGLAAKAILVGGGATVTTN